MNKKELKFYEAPLMDIVELDVAASILAGSAQTDPFDGSTADTEEME